MWEPSYGRIPPEFLIVKIVLMEPPAVCQSQFRFSYCCPGSHFQVLSLLQEAVTPGIYLSLSNLGDTGLPVPLLFYGSKRSC